MWDDLIRKWTGIEGIEAISYFDWSLRRPWPSAVLFLLILAAVGFAYLSYRRLLGNRSPYTVVLMVLRAATLILFCLLLFQPIVKLEFTRTIADKVLVLMDSSESMGIEDVRETADDIREVAMALGEVPLQGGELNPEITRPQAPRIDLVRGILTNQQWGLLDDLSARHDVLLYQFGGKLQSLRDDDDWQSLDDARANGTATPLGSAIETAVERHSGQALAGVVVLSDFAWNRGEDPIEVAKKMKMRGIPVYSATVGLTAPPDIRITHIYAKENLFVDDDYSVKVQIETTPGFAGAGGVLDLAIGGVQESRMLTFNGDVQAVEFNLTAPREAGTYTLEASVKGMEEEAVTANNALSRTIRVIDEKIRVLYVEGMPRWEYRYLRWVLLRNPRLDTTFLLTEGDRDLAVHSPHHIARFPARGTAGLDFDLVILGDVKSSFLNAQQIGWIEDLVKRRGGALLMIAGAMHAPSAYRDTALADLLPVSVGFGPWKKVSKRTTPLLTGAGVASGIVTLGDDPERSGEIWQRMLPLHAVPPVRAKPGSTVLMGLSGITVDGAPYPFLAWQRYGSGKSMFLASDKLWRIRYRVGRKHHEQCWAQVVQFLTLSRLLGGNKRVTIQSDRREYAVGEQVQVFADVLDRFLAPVSGPQYVVSLVPEDEEMKPEPVYLTPVPGIAGFYRGYAMVHRTGKYRIEAPKEDRDMANSPELRVLDVSIELRSPGLQLNTARQLAGLTGGITVESVRDVPGLADAIRSQTPLRIERTEIDVWDSPPFYVVIFLLAGSEWFLRRRRRMV